MKLLNGLLALALTPAAIQATPIVGGSPVEAGNYPYAVSIRQRSSAHDCDGTLINSRQVLTAGTCVDGIDSARTNIRVGSLSSVSGGTLIGVSKIRLYPFFDRQTFANDIAILDLNTAAANIQPADLPLLPILPQSIVTILG